MSNHLLSQPAADVAANLRYLNVILSGEDIIELDGETMVATIPKESITAIRLKHGSGAERPLLQLLVATVCILAGLHFLLVRTLSSKRGLLLLLSMLTLLIVGLWLLFEVVRRRAYLEVATRSDVRKIVFKGRVERQKLLGFIQDANTKLGYEIKPVYR